MFGVLHYQNFLYVIDFNNTVYFIFHIVPIGIIVRGELDTFQLQLNVYQAMALLRTHKLRLKGCFDEGVRNDLVDDTVNAHCFFLILKARNFDAVHAHSQLRCVQNSYSDEIPLFGTLLR